MYEKLFIPLQALEGSCEEKNAELLAVWTLKVTSLPNDGTGVMCQQKGSPEAPTATLHVYSKINSVITLI